MALPGKNTLVKVSTTAGGAGAYTTVDEIQSVDFNESGASIDVTKFDDDWISRIQGLKDCKWSLKGFWDPADTNGQLAIRNAWLNDTELWVQILPNGTTGFKQQVLVSSFNISTGVSGVAEVSIDLEGTGAIAAV